MGLFFIASIVYLIYALFFLTTILITIKRGERNCRNLFSEGIMIFSEVIYTIIGPFIGFMRFDEYGSDIPFAKQHVFIIILITIVSSASFWVARFTNKAANPVLRIIVSVGLLQGIVLCLFTTIHFLTFIPLGLIYPLMGFELLSPLFALIILMREFYFYNSNQFNYDDALPYRHELGFVPIPVKIIQSPFYSRIAIYGAMLLPLILSQVLLAFACGQDIDALVKAFTHSHGFIFSR